MTYTIILNNIEERDDIKAAVKTKHQVISTFQTTQEIDYFFNQYPNDSQLGIIYHNDNTKPFPIIKDGVFDIHDELLKHFFTKAKNSGINIIDLITCNINEPHDLEAIQYLTNTYGITIRYSLDDSSNENNWILESHNVDIKPIYFNNNIENFSSRLGTFVFGNTFAFLKNENNQVYTQQLGENIQHFKTASGTELATDVSEIIGTYGAGYYQQYSTGKYYYYGDNKYYCLPSTNIWFNYHNTSHIEFTDINIVKTWRGFRGLFFLRDDGFVSVYGQNSGTRPMGIGTTSRGVNTTIKDLSANAISDIVDVYPGYNNVFIKRSDDTIWGAGRGVVLAPDSTTANSPYMMKVTKSDGSDLTNVKKMASNSDSYTINGIAAAILNDNSILIWGYILNASSNTDTYVPCGDLVVTIPNETITDLVICDYWFIQGVYGANTYGAYYALTQSNKVYSIVFNNSTTPVITEVSDLSPTTIGGGDYVKKIGQHLNTLYALTANGNVYTCGHYPYSHGLFNRFFYNQTSWSLLDGVSNIENIVPASDRQYAIYKDRSVRIFGEYHNLINIETEFIPQPHLANISVQSVVGGRYILIILDTDGRIYVKNSNQNTGNRYYVNGVMTDTTYPPFEVTGYSGYVRKIEMDHAQGGYALDSEGYLYRISATSNTLTPWGTNITDQGIRFVDIATSFIQGATNLFALANDGNIYMSGNKLFRYRFGSPNYGSSMGLLVEDRFVRPISSIFGGYDCIFIVFDDGSVTSVAPDQYVGGINGWYIRDNVDYTNPANRYYFRIRGSANETLTGVVNIIMRGTPSYYPNYGKFAIFITNDQKAYVAGTSFGYHYTYPGTGTSTINTLTLQKYDSGSSFNSDSIKTNEVLYAPQLDGITGAIVTDHPTSIIFSKQDGSIHSVFSLRGLSIPGSNDYQEHSNTPIEIYPTRNVAINSEYASNYTDILFNKTIYSTNTTLNGNLQDVIEDISRVSIFKKRLRDVLIVNGSSFNSGETFRISSAELPDIFNETFASELNQATRNVLMKPKRNGKYIYTQEDVQNLLNGDVLYIPELGSAIGTEVTLTISDTDYQYSLFTDKLTYDGVDYDVGDTILFGDISLVIKGFDSTEFIVEGTTGTSALPCFGPGTLIETKHGPRPIETIKDGDHIWCSGKYQPVKVFKRTIKSTDSKSAPYLIKKDAIYKGFPSRDTIISQAHAILNPKLYMFTFPIHLQRFGLNVHRLPQGQSQTYYNLETPDYPNSIMIANGMSVETYANRQLRDRRLEIFYTPQRLKHRYPVHFKRSIISKKSIKRL